MLRYTELRKVSPQSISEYKRPSKALPETSLHFRIRQLLRQQPERIGGIQKVKRKRYSAKSSQSEPIQDGAHRARKEYVPRRVVR